MNGVAWTDARIEHAKQLNAQGLHPSEIAKELGGVSRNAVIGKMRRLSIALAHAGYRSGGRRPDARTGNADRALTMKFKRSVKDNNRYGTAAINIKAQERKEQIKKNRTKQRASEHPSLNIPFLDLEPHHCRYTHSEEAPYFFCGQNKLEESSYCGFHNALCHTRPATKEECEAAARQYRSAA